MKEHAMDHLLIRGDARHIPLADGSVHCVVTSPPYWGLRDYGEPGQIGLEPTPDEYVGSLVAVFVEVWRLLRDDGVVWLNLGDSYAAVGKSGGGRQGEKWSEAGADFVGPRGGKWRPAPPEVVWCKGSAMPESVTDRPTRAHEVVYLLSKRERYWYDADAVREPHMMRPQRRLSINRTFAPDRGKADRGLREGCLRDWASPDGHPLGGNLRSWWVINPRPFKGAHFAVMPIALAKRCIKAGCPKGGIVFDPFGGAGTTAVAALAQGRRAIVAELSARYLKIARRRIARPHAPPEREKAAEPLPLFDGATP
jgi:DNA modification methylase